MIRAGLMAFVIFCVISALIFGYRYITKEDIKIAGKLTFAAIISLAISTILFILETS